MKKVFCLTLFGGGTIPITASLYFKTKKVIASDLSGKAVDITRENFKTAEITKEKFVVFRSNVSMLKLPKEYVSKVITNLPFGVRTGDHEQNLKTYKSFAHKMKSILKGNGLVVILTQEKRLVRECFHDEGFKLVDSFDIEQGGLIPRVFFYKK